MLLSGVGLVLLYRLTQWYPLTALLQLLPQDKLDRLRELTDRQHTVLALSAFGVISALAGSVLHNCGAFAVLLNSSRLLKEGK